MSKLLDQPPEDRSRFISDRWRRIRANAVAQSESIAARRNQTDIPRPWKLPQINWSRWLACASVAAVMGYAGNFALAWMRAPSAQDVQSGEKLFAHVWERHDPLSEEGDGLGPVFNARSCAECHFQGGIGGGGGSQHNVSAFEVLPTLGHPMPTGGVIHAKTAILGCEESPETVRECFPIVPEGVTITAVCTAPLKRDYDPVIHHTVNTPTLFGAGQIDKISDLAIRTHQANRLVSKIGDEMATDFNSPGVGRLRILPDGRIGKFGWKAQFATLEEFVASACAVEIGLTTPSTKQHLPKAHREDVSAKPDLNQRQFQQLVAYIGDLPAPQLIQSTNPAVQSEVKNGRQLFTSIGCAACHTPDLGGAEGIYSDLCLHDVTDPQIIGYDIDPDVPVPENHPRPSEWKTPPLWGVAQTAPYMHDGSAPTLRDAIEAHAGQAKSVREKFRQLTPEDQADLLKFLGSLANE